MITAPCDTPEDMIHWCEEWLDECGCDPRCAVCESVAGSLRNAERALRMAEQEAEDERLFGREPVR